MSREFSPSVDAAFSVPFVHRLRFTEDVFGSDDRVLVELLEPTAPDKARFQVWVDEAVTGAQPGLESAIRDFARRHAERVTMTGGVEKIVGGEASKNDTHLIEQILKAINGANLDRRSYVVVIGGGAVLDAVGFAAAIAHRGIRLIRLPTTTLAQADSGIGVKNAVNLFHKKNWIGSFAVPWGVINDAKLLATLPDREFRCGFAEAVKVFLLKDAGAFERLCESAERIRQREMSVSMPVIVDSAKWHLKHITEGGDPFEMLEARPLDFGHWSAHKLETMTNFQLRHGEAVAIGVALDTLYSSLVHGLPASDAQRTHACLTNLGLPLVHDALLDAYTLFAGLEEFRQHLGGRLTLTMLEGVGRPVEVHEVDWRKMKEAIRQLVDLADFSMDRPAAMPMAN